jgi:hypothetical protein
MKIHIGKKDKLKFNRIWNIFWFVGIIIIILSIIFNRRQPRINDNSFEENSKYCYSKINGQILPVFILESAKNGEQYKSYYEDISAGGSIEKHPKFKAVLIPINTKAVEMVGDYGRLKKIEYKNHKQGLEYKSTGYILPEFLHDTPHSGSRIQD